MSSRGSLALLLHAHLPFVRHPEHEHFLEETWFFEAVTETYIPLISMMERLVREGIDFRFTMSLSPPLISMLADPLLQNRYLRHLDRLIELMEKEKERTRNEPAFHRTAVKYADDFAAARALFEDRYGRNLVTAFASFQDRGVLEILTCAATHGFLPLLASTPQAVRAQVGVAVDHYLSAFGRRPRGIWLPECGYQDGIDQTLAEYGIRYFILETHGVLHATPRPRFGIFRPVLCPSRVAAFGRDPESSKQVWSSVEGYPGDEWYREFYRDIGYDLDYDYIRPYLHPDGNRTSTGIKYFRVTGKGAHHEPYDPDRAREKAAEHAGNFMFNRERQFEHLHGVMGTDPIVVAPYDAELFGHWWFEGPMFLEYLIRKSVFDQNVFRLTTPGEFLDTHPEIQVCRPSPSSWGDKGYNEVWLNDSNDWIYPHLHAAAERMVELVDVLPAPDPLQRRALNQAARELLLAQSSDWAFIMNTGTMSEYAVKRTLNHLGRFNRLHDDLRHGGVDERWLAEVEGRDNIFPGIDYRIYSR
jgi:1,4-alpha-glucan branching enzyme